MKLHDLRPAEGSRTVRTRVGRGIAAGKGKTAGRGTKGQKSRAGASVPPWFEGGQTPLHQRIPKLRGFRNRFRIEYEVVNVGRIAELVSAGRLEADPAGGGARARRKAAPVTVNQEVLRATGLVSHLDRPLKILGAGDVDVAMFVVADAFSRAARTKIEAAGGTVQLLETPTEPLAALGTEAPATESMAEPPAAEAPATEAPATEAQDAPPAKPRAARTRRAPKAAPKAQGSEAAPADEAASTEGALDAPPDEPTSPADQPATAADGDA